MTNRKLLLTPWDKLTEEEKERKERLELDLRAEWELSEAYQEEMEEKYGKGNFTHEHRSL